LPALYASFCLQSVTYVLNPPGRGQLAVFPRCSLNPYDTESVKDSNGKIIPEAPLAIWGNFRQRALDTAIAEINKKTALHVEINPTSVAQGSVGGPSYQK
jgi:hypothetical protein